MMLYLTWQQWSAQLLYVAVFIWGFFVSLFGTTFICQLARMWKSKIFWTLLNVLFNIQMFHLYNKCMKAMFSNATSGHNSPMFWALLGKFTSSESCLRKLVGDSGTANITEFEVVLLLNCLLWRPGGDLCEDDGISVLSVCDWVQSGWQLFAICLQ